MASNLTSKTLEERFWSKVSKDSTGCWLWTGCVSGNCLKYGTLRKNGLPTKAHRVSWELHFGAIPAGLLVCHRCDVPVCVNPEHLFLGTTKDNIRDMIAKRRHISNKKTHCKRGHEFTPENLAGNRHGYRVCKSCDRHYRARARATTEGKP